MSKAIKISNESNVTLVSKKKNSKNDKNEYFCIHIAALIFSFPYSMSCTSLELLSSAAKIENRHDYSVTAFSLRDSYL